MEGRGRIGQPQRDQGSPSATTPRSLPSALRGPLAAGTRPPQAREPDDDGPQDATRGHVPPHAPCVAPAVSLPATLAPAIIGDSALNPHPVAPGHVTRGHSGPVRLLGPDPKSLACSGAQGA